MARADAPDPHANDPRASGPQIVAALAGHGLIARGWLALEDGEVDGFRSALLIGQAGASIWPYVRAWVAVRGRDVDHPVDAWTREVVSGIAGRFGAHAAFPFERPYLPFQRWAVRAEGLRPSPLGILMHPRYGLWHAYRGALLFEARISQPAPAEPLHLCDLCASKPCLAACPAGAWALDGFDRDACMAHLHAPAGRGCMEAGCMARNACPEAPGYRYPGEVQVHHQVFFRDGRLG